MFQRLRVVLSYEPGSGYSGDMAAIFGGLCNQLYVHVGMLALALQSGSEVVSILSLSASAIHHNTALSWVQGLKAGASKRHTWRLLSFVLSTIIPVDRTAVRGNRPVPLPGVKVTPCVDCCHKV